MVIILSQHSIQSGIMEVKVRQLIFFYLHYKLYIDESIFIRKDSIETTEPICFIDSNINNDPKFGGVFDLTEGLVMKNGC